MVLRPRQLAMRSLLAVVVILSVSGAVIAADSCNDIDAGPLPENPTQGAVGRRITGECVIFDDGAWRTYWECIDWKDFEVEGDAE